MLDIQYNLQKYIYILSNILRLLYLKKIVLLKTRLRTLQKRKFRKFGPKRTLSLKRS
jgi:hypothetical protein